MVINNYEMKIYRIIRTYQYTNAVYPETEWHTSYEYCKNYLDNMNSIRRESCGYTIEMNELIED